MLIPKFVMIVSDQIPNRGGGGVVTYMCRHNNLTAESEIGFRASSSFCAHRSFSAVIVDNKWAS